MTRKQITAAIKHSVESELKLIGPGTGLSAIRMTASYVANAYVRSHPVGRVNFDKFMEDCGFLK